MSFKVRLLRVIGWGGPQSLEDAQQEYRNSETDHNGNSAFCPNCGTHLELKARGCMALNVDCPNPECSSKFTSGIGMEER